MVNTLVVASFDIKILDGLFVRCKYIMKWQCNQYNASRMTESGSKSFIKNCDQDYRQWGSSIQHKKEYIGKSIGARSRASMVLRAILSRPLTRVETVVAGASYLE
jgi:hypothetical protein